MSKKKAFEIVTTETKPSIPKKPMKVYKVKSYSQRILEGFLSKEEKYATIKLGTKPNGKEISVKGIVRGLGRRIKEQKLKVDVLGYDEDKREVYLERKE